MLSLSKNCNKATQTQNIIENKYNIIYFIYKESQIPIFYIYVLKVNLKSNISI